MEAKVLNATEVKLGNIVAEDIMANTQYPIIYKDTKITRDHIPVLRAFEIKSLLVYTKSNVEQDSIEETKVEESEGTIFSEEQIAFEKKYSISVERFKKEFQNWQAGARVEIAKVREIILPLIEYILEDKEKIFSLNELSNVKEYVYHHSIATALIAAVIADKLKYVKGDIIQISLSAALADCGMAKVNEKIRNKKSALTEKEFEEIQLHPYYSLKMVKDLPLLKSEMKLAIYQHHERLDGSGYPRGEKGSRISTYAHIIAVADMFHAMTSERAYRHKESSFKVMEMIRQEEFGKFNIQVVQALLQCVGNLPLGTKVELSTGELGEIVFTNKTSVTKPLVKLITTKQIIDLSTSRDLYIERLIHS